MYTLVLYMSKGRNTTVVTIRIPDSVYSIAASKAEEAGTSPGQIIQQTVIETMTKALQPLEPPGLLDMVRDLQSTNIALARRVGHLEALLEAGEPRALTGEIETGEPKTFTKIGNRWQALNQWLKHLVGKG